MANKKVTEKTATAAATTLLEASSKLQKLEAAKQEAINKVNAKYADELAGLEDTIKTNAELVEAYAVQEREVLLPGDAKSCGFQGIEIGFRKSADSVGYVEGWEEKTVIEKAKKYLPEFVKEKLSIDKTGLKRRAEELAKPMAKCGIEIKAGTDSFFWKLP